MRSCLEAGLLFDPFSCYNYCRGAGDREDEKDTAGGDFSTIYELLLVLKNTGKYTSEGYWIRHCSHKHGQMVLFLRCSGMARNRRKEKKKTRS